MHQPQLRVPYVTSSPTSSWSLSLKSTQLVWHLGSPAFGRRLSSNPKIKPFHRKLWIVHTSTNPKKNNIAAIDMYRYIDIIYIYGNKNPSCLGTSVHAQNIQQNLQTLTSVASARKVLDVLRLKRWPQRRGSCHQKTRRLKSGNSCPNE